MANPTFRGWLAEEPKQEAGFKARKGAFDQRRQLFERIRNEMGEHVAQHVGATVHEFKSGGMASAEVDRDTGVPTAKLAETIMLYALMPGVAADQREMEFLRIITELHDATIEAMRAMIIALSLYAKRYPFFPQTR